MSNNLYRWVKWSEKIPDNWEDKINRQTTTGIVLNNSDWMHKNDRLNEDSDNAHCDFIFYQDLEWLEPIEESEQEELWNRIYRYFISEKNFDQQFALKMIEEIKSIIKR